MSILNKIIGDPNKKVISQMQPLVDQINGMEAEIEKLSDADLKAKTDYFRQQLKGGKTVDDILPEAFAVVREASKRTTGLRPYDVQIYAAIVLHRGEIAEMRTGEGKTLAATMPVYLNALSGKGVHVVTVNDYLARRDTVWMGQVYHFLGLSTASIQGQLQSYIYDQTFEGEEAEDLERDQEASYKVAEKYLRPCTRKEAYLADITYGTNNEYGFDFLRDNMAPSLAEKTQRKWHYAIIDEVDSILIDEARTPLIISAPAEESASLYYKFAQIIPQLKENEHYNIDEKMRAATLTEQGLNRIEQILGMGNIYTEGGVQMVHHLEQALRAQTLFKRDRDYVVKDGEVIIIDEFTGRLMVGRRYSEGLHQAIEAKEGVEIKKESRTLATITFQNYFRQYEKLSGMTGTALTEAEEFHKIYNLEVTAIPTNKPVIRKDKTDRIYSTQQGKYQAVIKEIKRLHEKGQPVLVGTISIQQNELLDQLLTKAGVPHQVLNAKQHEKEAQIIAQAGQVGAVTIATNMAGRGVDIILGGAPFNQAEFDKVIGLGGLFVLGTERHESRRIDNQLRGRSGRQGDPGASQFYVSMEDDLMRIFGSDRVKNMMQRLGVPEDVPIENKMISSSLEQAQKKVEGNNFDIRKHLVEYDDVMNKQREVIYSRRDEYLDLHEENPAGLKDKILEMVEDELEQVISFHTAGVEGGQWNLGEIAEVAATIFPIPENLKQEIDSIAQSDKGKLEEAQVRTKILEYLMDLAKKAYLDLEQAVSQQSGQPEYMQTLEKEMLIRSVDNLWVEHLDAMAALRQGIGLRGYGQRDPLIEYKKEGKQLFVQLLNLIQKQVVYAIYKVGYTSQMAQSVMQSSNVQMTAPQKTASDTGGQFKNVGQDPYKQVRRQESAPTKKTYDSSGQKVGRNDPCPCGSGKKFKKCCG
jgi:preprotein translocase subunit SecA